MSRSIVIVIGLAIATRSILPLLFAGFTNVFGTWLLATYGYTQPRGDWQRMFWITG